MGEREKFLKEQKKRIKKYNKKTKEWLEMGSHIACEISRQSMIYNHGLEKLIKSGEITGDTLKPIPKEEVWKMQKALKLINSYLEDNVIPTEESLW